MIPTDRLLQIRARFEFLEAKMATGDSHDGDSCDDDDSCGDSYEDGESSK